MNKTSGTQNQKNAKNKNKNTNTNTNEDNTKYNTLKHKTAGADSRPKNDPIQDTLTTYIIVTATILNKL